MVEELDKETQEDPIPPLPKGFKVVKSSGGSDLPPLPQGYSVKKKRFSKWRYWWYSWKFQSPIKRIY